MQPNIMHLLDRLTLLHKVLIGSAIIFLLVVGFYFVIYTGQTADIRFLKQEIERLQSLNKTYSQRQQNIEIDKACLDELTYCYNNISIMLPEQGETNKLMGEIIRKGKDAGLEFLFFQESNEIKTEVDDYAIIPITIHVRGYFFQIYNFFQSLLDNRGRQSFNRIVTIEKATIKDGIPSEAGISLRAEILARAYRHLTDQEIRERQEQLKAADTKKKKR